MTYFADCGTDFPPSDKEFCEQLFRAWGPETPHTVVWRKILEQNQNITMSLETQVDDVGSNIRKILPSRE